MDVGRPAEIRCNVDAVPLTASTITWRREGYDLGKGVKLVMRFSRLFSTFLVLCKRKCKDLKIFHFVPKLAGIWQRFHSLSILGEYAECI